MPEMNFEGTASWTSGAECELTVKGKQIAVVSPLPAFGGKEGYCLPEVFVAALASCMNTLFLLIAKNSNFNMKFLDSKATVKMNVEGLERLIFTDVRFNMAVKHENNTDNDRREAEKIYQMAQKICPLRQSWGENVPIIFYGPSNGTQDKPNFSLPQNLFDHN